MEAVELLTALSLDIVHVEILVQVHLYQYYYRTSILMTGHYSNNRSTSVTSSTAPAKSSTPGIAGDYESTRY